MSENPNWTVRYDVVRKLPNGECLSCCFFPSGPPGFGTAHEAIGIMNDLAAAQKKAATIQGAAYAAYEVWPIAVHDDYDLPSIGMEMIEEDDDNGKQSKPPAAN